MTGYKRGHFLQSRFVIVGVAPIQTLPARVIGHRVSLLIRSRRRKVVFSIETGPRRAR